jgi:hypothetical protein
MTVSLQTRAPRTSAASTTRVRVRVTVTAATRYTQSNPNVSRRPCAYMSLTAECDEGSRPIPANLFRVRRLIFDTRGSPALVGRDP